MATERSYISRYAVEVTLGGKYSTTKTPQIVIHRQAKPKPRHEDMPYPAIKNDLKMSIDHNHTYI